VGDSILIKEEDKKPKMFIHFSHTKHFRFLHQPLEKPKKLSMGDADKHFRFFGFPELSEPHPTLGKSTHLIYFSFVINRPSCGGICQPEITGRDFDKAIFILMT
jgi:hypothetical protein